MNKILFIDDEPRTEAAVRYFRIVHDISIDWIDDAEEALKKIKEEPYSTIILDIMMPVLSNSAISYKDIKNINGLSTGEILLLLIRRHYSEVGWQIPQFIFCSAKSKDNMESNLEEKKDYLCYLQKPYDIIELYALLTNKK